MSIINGMIAANNTSFHQANALHTTPQDLSTPSFQSAQNCQLIRMASKDEINA